MARLETETTVLGMGLCPTISFSRIILEQGESSDSLLVTADVALEDIDEGGLFGGILDEELLARHLKIRVMTSLNSTATKILIESVGEVGRRSSWGELGDYSREYSITDILRTREEYEYIAPGVTTSTGDVVRKIPFTVQFEFGEAELRLATNHLTIFAFSYFDFSDIGFGLELPGDYQNIRGDMHYRKIFDKGNLQGSSDSVIQDFRILRNLEEEIDTRYYSEGEAIHTSLLASLDRSSFFINKSFNELVSDSSYFTDLLFTRGADNRVNFEFGFDLNEVIKKNSTFGHILAEGLDTSEIDFFDTTMDEVITNVRNASKFLLFRLLKRRVQPLTGINRIGGVDYNNKLFYKNNPEHILLNNAVDHDGYVDRHQASESRGTPWGSEGTRPALGWITTTTVEPIGLGEGTRTGIHLFSCSERLSSGEGTFGVTAPLGHYQYGIELEFEDGTIHYFIQQYEKLFEVEAGLNEYIELLDLSETQAAIRRRGRGVENEITIEQLRTKYNERFEPALRTFLFIYIILSRREDSRWLEWGRRPETFIAPWLRTLTEPQLNGDSRGIRQFSRLLRNLIKEMEKLIGSLKRPAKPSGGDGAVVPPSKVEAFGNSGVARRTIKLKKWFPEVRVLGLSENVDEARDRLVASNIGYEYLSNPTTTNLDKEPGGLKVIGLDTLAARLEREILKYFTTIDTSFTITTMGDEKISLNTHIDSTYLCFSPSIVRMDGLDVHFLREGLDIWEAESNDLLAAKILNYKKTGNLRGNTALTKRQEKMLHYHDIANGLNLSFSSTSSPRVSSMANASEVLGKAWPGENEVEDLKRIQEKDSIGLFRNEPLMSSIVTQLLVSESNKFNLDLLNPATINNIFSSRNNSRSTQELVDAMPLQIKSIVAAAAGAKSARYDWSKYPTNPFLDSKILSGFIFNYLLLCKVEYLSGYQVSDTTGRVLLKHPIWEAATLSKLAGLKQTDILCRLSRFEDSDMPHIEIDGIMSLPLYNEYFIVRK